MLLFVKFGIGSDKQKKLIFLWNCVVEYYRVFIGLARQKFDLAA